MVSWLVRTFVRDSDDVGNPRVRASYGLLSSMTCIVLNLVLCAAKGLVGVVSGSVSIVADAVNNLSDASSNIVSLVGFKLASRPADQGHPYGHGRYEYLAGMLVSVMIILVGVELGRSSIERIMSPSPAEFGVATVLALLLSICVKLWMAHFNRTLARRIDSVTLEATAVDSRNDVITSSAVLVAAIVSATTPLDLDGWMGLAVAAFIVWSGFGLLGDTVNPLLGDTPNEQLVQRVHDKILSYPGVLGTHDLLIHDYGPGRQFASAHVQMNADTTVRESHRVLDQIERDLLEQDNLRIVLHCDPVEMGAGGRDLMNWLNVRVRQIDPRLSVHDVDTEHGKDSDDHLVTLDVVRPDDLGMSDDELRERVCAAVRERVPEARCQITVDSGYVSPAK